MVVEWVEVVWWWNGWRWCGGEMGGGGVVVE